ncbi:DUF1801 domain-containing protein [Ancylomarina sp. 16SWW S1-10-2]|uniref:DUF1801 domain-containing protein n=1 Tax=Ancylomarina sp. 16SWW S1-10-2 TaxID=2499681 RepID=UPI0012AE148C|nr:DUF1801 domain-containing protein [Ancylomarina sp. 16SWW S1-10-2]MRT92688.1 DUF1801 domain-containing protein [Ancylomarina sp. 16SWW S1-10-2]
MIDELYVYYSKHDEENQNCLYALRSIILGTDELVSETMKWNLPCFCYKGKMFCFINVEKESNQPYILFVEGGLLNHPELEQGERVRMKIYRVDAKHDLPIETISLLLNEALDLYKNGRIKIK